MKRTITLITLAMLALTLPACVSKSTYTDLKERYQEAQAEIETHKESIASLESEANSLKQQVGSLEQQREELEKQASDLIAQLEDTQAKLNTCSADLEQATAELEQVRGELQELQAKYPPRRFSSAEELETWLNKQPSSPKGSDAILWFKHALRLQEAAARDGYIISAYLVPAEQDGYWIVYCEAILENGDTWIWDPDTRELYYIGNSNQF